VISLSLPPPLFLKVQGSSGLRFSGAGRMKITTQGQSPHFHLEVQNLTRHWASTNARPHTNQIQQVSSLALLIFPPPQPIPWGFHGGGTCGAEKVPVFFFPDIISAAVLFLRPRFPSCPLLREFGRPQRRAKEDVVARPLLSPYFPTKSPFLEVQKLPGFSPIFFPSTCLVLLI